MTWVLDEDDALKQKLSGFSLKNQDGRLLSIPVYFRFPDTEERSRTFPHIAIDLVDIQFDAERAARAQPFAPVWMNQATPPPEIIPPNPGFAWVVNDLPLPWQLIYQLAAYSRDPRHDRQLLSLLYRLFPEEYGFLDMSTLDGTIRRADLVNVVRRDTRDANQKRLYRFIMSISVSSEFFVNQAEQVALARSIDITYVPYVNTPAVPQ